MSKFKAVVRKRLPGLVNLTRQLRRRRWNSGDIQQKFTWIYQNNYWRSDESVSGTGSTMLETRELRRTLPALLKRLDVKCLLDVPCGDFNWMSEIDDCVERYIGADVVQPLVDSNQQFASSRRQFVCLDVTKDKLPECDLILCRDCLVHFAIEDIWRALNNFARCDAKYLALTTFADVQQNQDIPTGAWRKINLQKPPFDLPLPIANLCERSQEDCCEDKTLAIFDLAAVRQLVKSRRAFCRAA